MSIRNFLDLPKFHIFSRSEKSWGDKIALRQRQRQRQRQRTPRTIIIARQDSFRILRLITKNGSKGDPIHETVEQKMSKILRGVVQIDWIY